MNFNLHFMKDTRYLYGVMMAACFCILLFSCSGQASETIDQRAQSHAVHREGDVHVLSKNIMSIYHDSKGNHWFGSWVDGLYMLRDSTWTHFNTENGLPANRVEEIKEDNFGHVIINTAQGFCLFDGEKLRMIETMDGSERDWKLSPDDLWFKSASSEGYVFRYDGNQLIKLKLPTIGFGEDWIAKYPNASIPYSVYCTYKDNRGNIWFGTAALGPCRFDGHHFDWITETDLHELHDGPSNGIRSIIEDRQGMFWFNSSYKYQIDDNLKKKAGAKFYRRLESIGSLDGIETNNMTEYLSITKDFNQDLWIATYRFGVWKIEGKKVIHYPIQVHGEDVTSFYIYCDRDGLIWLGTEENGVFTFDGNGFVQFIK